MAFWQAVILGIVEGITEFLPISSTGHLTIVSALMGYEIDDAGVTAFTAVIQIGAIAAVIVFFWKDIIRLLAAWFRGLRDPEQRGTDYREAWIVIAGSIPIGLIGFALRHVISGPLRNMWVIVGALVVWSFVMWYAERIGTQRRGEDKLNMRDAVVIGLAQCIALIPGISRSGATISAGLFRGLDRVAATRVSFFLSIPSLLAAGAYQAIGEYGNIGHSVGWTATGIATVVSFIVAIVAIAWLLKLVAKRPITVFVWYRLALAAVVAVLLLTGVVSATGGAA
ncbi:MAG: undecaprenyl-diphosphate phosphatase [Cellulomonadaceae bacterium]|nr:undecaprenyl-diphosphate phosphatase [Cellulomonadaceae bacterium]